MLENLKDLNTKDVPLDSGCSLAEPAEVHTPEEARRFLVIILS
jgi:hypothetical protein